MERKVLKTYEEVANWYHKHDFIKVAFDTETTSLKYTELEIEGMSFCNGTHSCYIDLINNPEFNEIMELVKEFFESEIKVLICHNIVYDMKVLHKYGITCDHIKIYDTMVADHLLDENRRHSLKFLAQELLGHEVQKWEDVERLGHQSEAYYNYAMNDAIWTWELMKWQQEPLKEQQLVNLFRQIEMPFQFVLLEMEINGVKVDLKKVNETKNVLEGKILDLECELHDELDLEYDFQTDLFGSMNMVSQYNFNSSHFLAKTLFEDLELQPIEQTPSGANSVGKLTLEAYKKHDFVAILRRYKIAQKLLTSFFSPLPSHVDSDGRVRPNFRDIGTRTGRLSCNNPNLQQLPKINKDLPIDTRECFIVDKEESMVTCDYSGQELRVLTEISQEPVLIDTFIKGKDMHLSTANDFFELGIPEEELYDNNPKCEEHKKTFKEERNKAKIINFGMAYGKGAYGFSKDFGISEEEAQEILDKYFAALPKVKQAIDVCHNSVKQKGYCVSLTGRRRRFQQNEQGYYPQSAYRQSFNFLIQGFSADMIRIAGIKVLELKKQNPHWKMKILATVHDEYIFSVHKQHTKEMTEAVKKCFEEAVDFCIPVVADIEVGNNYGNAK